jgi:hypothetical protein
VFTAYGLLDVCVWGLVTCGERSAWSAARSSLTTIWLEAGVSASNRLSGFATGDS